MKNLLLIAAAAILIMFPMFFNLGDPAAEEPFAGTDAGAETVVAENNPGYEPWFESVAGELPGEVEAGRFALQAGLGAGVVGYVLGVYRGRSQREAPATA
ncbi:energy-coupling factor ABC transporter substrate-binding protein [Corynebacterium sp. H128]|uniref:energy-coupling factor ABC transporter substrate-binding protein n=1 Tax=unclassified Corynebacterium TaxID=2624378 RepID=UPI0030A806FD